MKEILAGLFLSLSFSGFAQIGGCEPTGTCNGANNHIQSVTVGEISYINNSCSPDGYGNYTNKYFVGDPGEVLVVSVDWALYSNHAAKVWFDWNGNNDFSDDGEALYMPMSSPDVGGSTTVQVPETANIGDTIFVRAATGVATTMVDANACGIGTVGSGFREYEDYSLIIGGVLSGYCDAQGNAGGFGGTNDCNDTTNALDTYVTRVKFDGQFDNSGTSCGETSKGYTDFTNLVATVAENDAYTITVEIFSEGNNYENVKAWIDWNGDFTFDPATEALVTTNIPGENTFVFTGTVDPSLTEGFTGLTGMRVAGYWNYVNAVYLPCGQYTIGEIEDYSVFIGTPPPNCAENLSPSDGTRDLCQNGNMLTWDAPSAGDTPNGYKVSLGTDNPPSNVLDSLDVGDTTKHAVTATLQAGATYYWQVIAYNDNGDAVSCDVNTFTVADKGDPNVEILLGNATVTNAAACTGVDLNLDAVVTGGTGNLDFTWTGQDLSNLDATTNPNVVFNASNIGPNNFLVTVEDDNGCADSTEITITVEENASAGIIGGFTKLCNGESLDLTASNTVGDLQWQKTFGSNWFDINGATSAVYTENTPSDGVGYRLIASTANCADTSAVINVVVHPLAPAPTVSTSNGENGYCEGASVDLTSSENANNHWSTGSNDQTITVSQVGAVTLYYEDANGCNSDVATINIEEYKVPAKPEINGVNASNEIYACGGYPKLVHTTTSDFDISWVGFPGETNDTLVLNADAQVRAVFTSDKGCSDTSNVVSVVEKDLPSKPVISSDIGGFEFCEGSSIELSAAVDASVAIVWNDDPLTNSNAITVDRDGNYFLNTTNQFGCVSYSDTVEVVVNALPEKPTVLTKDNQSDFCDNEVVFLTSDADNGFWTGAPSTSSDTLFITAAGSYTINFTAENEEGCEAVSDDVELTVFSAPEVPVISNNNGELSSSVQDESLDYQWFNGDGTPVEDEVGPIFENAPDGDFYLVISDPVTGCSSQSTTVTGIAGYNLDFAISIYPNPVTAGDMLRVSSTYKPSGIILKDTAGRLVTSSNTAELNTAGLSQGLYIVEVTFSDVEGIVKARVILQ